MPKSYLENVLLDHAGGHNIKVLGRSKVTRHNVEIIKHMICQAAERLRSMPPGDTVIVEGIRPDLFIVARSREDKQPRRPACCDRSGSHTPQTQPPPADRLTIPSAPFKPSPPGRT
jgi:hypothetical protein